MDKKNKFKNKKLVFISNMAAPYQVKKCYILNKYIDAEFWFYKYIEKNRPFWWKIPLGNKCHVLDSIFSWKGKYLAADIYKQLSRYNPDIVMLGGFSIPGNYLAYLWAKKHHKKTVVFTELSRDSKGNLRTEQFIWKILRYLYKDVDLIMTANIDAFYQFQSLFPKNKVVESLYGSDIDELLKHPLREPKTKINILYANRLTKIYEPILAIKIFKKLTEKYYNLELSMNMNADGELRDDCIQLIKHYSLQNKVKFIDSIQSWDDLHKVYLNSDLLILPASFSNGNFTIIEAMASGMGIVCSNRVKGNQKDLEDGVNAFVRPPTLDAFVEALSIYIDNMKLLKKHGQINKQKVKHLSLESAALTYIKIFEQEDFL